MDDDEHAVLVFLYSREGVCDGVCDAQDTLLSHFFIQLFSGFFEGGFGLNMSTAFVFRGSWEGVVVVLW